MKKIITLLLSLGSITAVFAQSGHRSGSQNWNNASGATTQAWQGNGGQNTYRNQSNATVGSYGNNYAGTNHVTNNGYVNQNSRPQNDGNRDMNRGYGHDERSYKSHDSHQAFHGKSFSMRSRRPSFFSWKDRY